MDTATLGAVYASRRLLDPTAYEVPAGTYEPTLTYVALCAGLRFVPRPFPGHRDFLERHDFEAWVAEVTDPAYVPTPTPPPSAAAKRAAAKAHGPRGKGKRS